MNRAVRIFFLSLCVMMAQLSVAQVISDKTSFDFGDIGADDQHYVDFKLSNVSSEVIKIVKYDAPYGISLRFSDEEIEPDGSVMVRIKYTPKRKGNFAADVPIWVSSNNEPIVLSVSGKATSFNLDEGLDVPQFEKEQEKKIDQTFDLKIKVVRKEDGTPVSGATLDIIWDGVLMEETHSNENGELTQDFIPDKYYIVVNADNLGTFESELHIHKNIREFIIELGPEGTTAQVTEDSADVYEIEVVEAEPEPVAEPDPVVVPDPIPEKKYENPDFPDEIYVPNNIVFLIDVSVSMKQKGRMNLLKASMMELTSLLRSVDKVAIVTYASKTDVALKSTSARNKQEIKEVIRNLEAKGSTSGSKGVKKAYQVLAANEIKGGNNQIFISTDGAFNLEKQDRGMLSTVKKNAKKGYKISVIGIKNEKWTVKNMKLIAEEGKGNYLHISNYNSAKKLIVEEVKRQSKNSQ